MNRYGLGVCRPHGGEIRFIVRIYERLVYYLSRWRVVISRTGRNKEIFRIKKGPEASEST